MKLRMVSLCLTMLACTATASAAPPPPAPPSSQGNAAEETRTQTTRSSDRPQADSRASVDDNVSLRGPLHEAFARPVSLNPARQPVIEHEPPEPLNEVPPEYRPDGDNIIWIPGYWSFDDVENDFLWISGLWRDVPPQRRWVPGYWSEVDAGFQWTPGEWISSNRRSMTYLPEPPRSQERGASSPPPGDGYFWVPGCWEYRDRDYAWRPGYWSRHQENWVWTPAHYDWTPNGYVYCDGYWDYDIDRRGIVYAPYRFGNRRVSRYTPTSALDVSSLLLHLFVNNRTQAYCFGDYYQRDAYRPWYTWHDSRFGYDPIYNYNSWRHGEEYLTRLSGWNRYFTQNQRLRPRTTLTAHRQFLGDAVDSDIARRVTLARTVTNDFGGDLFGRRIVPLRGAERDSIVQTAGSILNLVAQRSAIEARGRSRVSAASRADARANGRAAINGTPFKLPEATPLLRRATTPRGAVPELPGVLERGTRGARTGGERKGSALKDAVGKGVDGLIGPGGKKNRLPQDRGNAGNKGKSGKKNSKGKGKGVLPSLPGLK